MKRLFLGLSILFMLFGCVSRKFYISAKFDQAEAELLIDQLKDDTLVVLIPTYFSKEKFLKKDMSNRGKRQLADLYKERDIDQKELIDAFVKNYTFSKVLFIPDSLIYDFESGIERAYFINISNNLDPSLSYSNRLPIKLLQQLPNQWIVKTKATIVPNPFPNKISLESVDFGSPISKILGLGGKKSYQEGVATFQKRLEQFLLFPKKKIFL